MIYIIRQVRDLFLKLILAVIRRRRVGKWTHHRSYELSLFGSATRTDISDDIYDIPPRVVQYMRARKIAYPNPHNAEWDHYFRRRDEHYTLLAGLVNALGVQRFVEVGTFLGASSLIVLMNSECTVTSYDIVEIDSLRGSYAPLLNSEAFGSRFVQRIADLSIKERFAENSDVMSGADLIFLDGPKDGAFEERLFSLIASQRCASVRFVLFDDIYTSTTVEFWNSIEHPKIDISWLGHWSGSGLVRLDPTS